MAAVRAADGLAADAVVAAGEMPAAARRPATRQAKSGDFLSSASV
jgi:hypothetical protein